ncbi:AAHS family 3-hydroxyphenylpropionic acid transporter [Pseudomonas duriflava]|uniref:AAHS family 3-hydroxyphenylpropionic acid transporter n=1 Tax=Pseudomonas duriflava TaxID=459528 RepID=A0A562Q2M3_9PSED|nr:3-(3-hydroxy-phenyl)propionate transporter MhpT [Pseudomonas duriflava]TWI50919.1 AAHS family 3-hydroxyphenylpropionic acid transporter [Pseudomonas duriflava]
MILPELRAYNMRVTITLCFVVALIEGLDLQSAGIAAAGIREAFSLSPSMMGWMFSSSIIGLLPGAFIGGWLADRIGRKRVLAGSVILFGIFSLATAYCADVYLLLIVRFLTGLGLGAALPNLIALSSEAVEERYRSTAISVMYCGVPLGGATASLISMLFPSNWQTIFIVGGIAPLLVAPLIMFVMPESEAFHNRASAKKAHAAEQTDTRIGLLTEGRAVSTLTLWMSYFFTLTVMYMMLNWLPTLLIDQGFSRPQASGIQMMFGVGGAVGSLAAGLLLDRINQQKVTLGMYALVLASLTGLAFSTGFPAMMLSGFVFGFAILGSQLVLYSLAPRLYPTRIRATGVGSAVAVGRLGSVAGPLVAGQLLALGVGSAGVLGACMPGLVIASLAAVRLLGGLKVAKNDVGGSIHHSPASTAKALQ